MRFTDAYQDGAAFYLTPENAERDADGYAEKVVVTAPMHVADFDSKAARTARAWFDIFAHGSGWTVEWEA